MGILIDSITAYLKRVTEQPTAAQAYIAVHPWLQPCHR
jgi:hypothetical protein